MKRSLRTEISRRETVALAVGAVAAAALPGEAAATPEEVTESIAETFGPTPIQDGRILVTVPKLAETGNSVPVAVVVESPMTDGDYVKRIAIFAEQNPRPKIVEVFLSQACGRARLETSIRLSGTQGLVVVAEMSDGSLWKVREQVQVVIGACTALSARY